MSEIIRHYIDGGWSADAEGQTSTLTNPATGTPSGKVALGTPADVDRAVSAARRAFGTWSVSTVPERVELLQAIAAEYARRTEEMALAVTTDIGMPLAGSRTAVQAALFQFQQLVEGLPTYAFEERRGSYTLRKEPIGVCGLIPPWNYPALQMAEKVAPALAAGCTMVLKPAEVASHSGAVFAEVMHAAGTPRGVFNMVVGKGSVVGTTLTRHPDVDMIAFTGSTRVGIQVQKDAAETVKRVGLELGGKSAHVVLPDADFAAAAQVAVSGVMGNSGQTCAAPTRTLVPRSRLAEFLDLVRDDIATITVGDPLTDVSMGPVVSQTQWDTVQSYIEIGLKEGATLVSGGAGKPDGHETGWFVRPTVFADVTNDMRLAREEIFGPVMSVIAYDTVDEAVDIANDSPYGLAAYIHGTDPNQVRDVATRLRAGQVVVNSGYPDLTAPFGGYKQSGNGRVWGLASLEEYLEAKAVVAAP
ncbi:aldehyde dehydrogenase family protein [Jiangella endophytica]|uniref:aldehyde dehydrogenase family protein n=1 Tax=Jiangella endophytica TaxID=1623398 RepID=UPI000E34717E|nr:aldehyde dehydrogenase family protein [Jiangella endophytica]